MVIYHGLVSLTPPPLMEDEDLGRQRPSSLAASHSWIRLRSPLAPNQVVEPAERGLLSKAERVVTGRS